MSSEHQNGAKLHHHERALDRDLSEYFDVGDRIEVIIEEPPSQNGGEEAKATTYREKSRDVVVFITPGEKPLHRGDRVRCRIKHVGNNHLKAVVVCKLD